MGTITKRGELQWQAKVRRKGYPAQSRTFSYKECVFQPIVDGISG